MSSVNELREQIGVARSRLTSQKTIRSTTPVQRRQMQEGIESAEQRLSQAEAQERQQSDQSESNKNTQIALRKIQYQIEGKYGGTLNKAERKEYKRLLAENPELQEKLDRLTALKTGQLDLLLPKTINKEYQQLEAKPIFKGYEVVGYQQGGQGYSSAYLPQKVIVNAPETQSLSKPEVQYLDASRTNGQSLGQSRILDSNSNNTLSSPQDTQVKEVYQRRLVFENIPGTKIPIPIPRLKGEFVPEQNQTKGFSRESGEFLGRITENVVSTGPQQFFNILEAKRTKVAPEPSDVKQGLAYGILGGASVVSRPILLGVSGYSAYQAAKIIPSIVKEPSGINVADLTLATAGAYPVGKFGYTKGYDLYRTRGLEKLEIADYQTKPVIINDKPVFMRRYEGIQLNQPRSWIESFKYKKGQYVKRQYRVVSPEVMGFYEGKSKVTYYDLIDGKIQRVTKETTRFPYDKPSTFKEYFDVKSQEVYGLPVRSGLPIDTKNKPFGYSATGKQLSTNKIGEAGQFYSGKGVSLAFLRLNNKYSGLESPIITGNKPMVYATYGTKSQVVPDAFEIKVRNPYEVGGKPIKKYIFPGIEKREGTFYIPTNKPEVQAVVYGELVPLRKQFYFDFAGRRVPIQENVVFDNSIKEISLLAEKTGTVSSESSILPTRERGKYISSLPLQKSSEISLQVYSSIPLVAKRSGPSGSTTSRSGIISPLSSQVYFGSSYTPPSYPSSPPPSYVISPPSPPSSRPYGSPPTRPTLYPPRTKKSKERQLNKREKEILANAFRTYYLRQGKREYLPGFSTRAEAIRRGETKVLGGVAATFGVEETSQLIRTRDEGYSPSEKIFRNYRIKGKNRIALGEEWIQKAGTRREPTVRGARLSARSEIKELLSFRRRR